MNSYRLILSKLTSVLERVLLSVKSSENVSVLFSMSTSNIRARVPIHLNLYCYIWMAIECIMHVCIQNLNWIKGKMDVARSELKLGGSSRLFSNLIFIWDKRATWKMTDIGNCIAFISWWNEEAAHHNKFTCKSVVIFKRILS